MMRPVIALNHPADIFERFQIQINKKMIVEQTSLAGVLVVRPDVFGDERGFFLESYQAEKYSQAGITDTFVQDNHSGSRRGTLRGLHYQIQHPQTKLVRVAVGEIYDVAVDIRRKSETFGQWFGVRLSAENKKQLFVPKGFAHGFYVLSEWAEVLYKASDFYAPEWERSLLWNDPQVGIDWQLAGELPILSERDKNGKSLQEAVIFED